MARGKGNVLAFVNLWLVQNPELDRIHLELVGHFVHGRLRCEKSGHRAWPAHVGRCADVAPGPSEMHPQVWRAVMKRRRFTAILLVNLEDRAVTDVIVFEREKLAFRRRAEPHPLLGAGAMTSRLKRHLATEDELDRLA